MRRSDKGEFNEPVAENKIKRDKSVGAIKQIDRSKQT
jgi:hypothetical protein